MDEQNEPKRRPRPPRPTHEAVMDAFRLYNAQSVTIEDQFAVTVGEVNAVRLAAERYKNATDHAAGAAAMERYSDDLLAAAEETRTRRRRSLAIQLAVALAEQWPANGAYGIEVQL